MASNTPQLTHAISRLNQFTESITGKKDAILQQAQQADADTDKPVNKDKYVLDFTDYCICKLFGVKSPAYLKGNSGLFKDKNKKYTSALYIYFYWKITDASTRAIADDFKPTSKSEVSRKINLILYEEDINKKSKIMYIQQHIDDFKSQL